MSKVRTFSPEEIKRFQRATIRSHEDNVARGLANPDGSLKESSSSYEPSNFKRALNKSHNLKDIISNYRNEVALDRYGVANDTWCQNIPDNKISGFVDAKDGIRDESIVAEYIRGLKNHVFDAEPYFTKFDGEIYYLVKAFYASEYHSREQSKALIDISRFYNKLNRQVNDDTLGLLKKAEFADERIGASNVRKAYAAGSVVTIAPPLDSPVPFGISWNRNPLKEAAWIVAHSYLIDVFIPEKTQMLLIPRDTSLVELWNSHIDEMPDIPDLVKKYFHLDKNANCIFKDVITGEKKTIIEEEPVAKEAPKTFEDAIVKETKVEIVEEPPKAQMIPSDDSILPFEDAIVVEVVGDKAIEMKNKEMDKDMKEAVARDDAKEETKKAESKTIVKESKKEDSIVSPHRDNNLEFEKKTKNLDRFTKLVHMTGCYVNYAESSTFPGLIEAIISISNGSETKSVNRLLIDPNIIYGDSLRVVSLTNNNADIRKEVFVSINQPELVTKLILATFTKEDRDKHNQELPRVLNDFRNKYHLLDRVDLSKCAAKYKNGVMPYGDWRKMIVNISNVLKDESIPVCRFRVADVESADKFKLICDIYTKAVYMTPIFNEPSNGAALESGLWIDFDAAKYKKTNGYVVMTKK